MSLFSAAQPTIEDVFLSELDTAIQAEEAETGFAASEWMTAGARGCQDRDWWEGHGPELVRNFTSWYESNPDASVWHTPDGEPAIELPLDVTFGSVRVRMIVDLVLQIGTALVVTDHKSGARSPDGVSQLSIYASGIELQYGIRPKYGTFFMLRGVGKEEPKTHFLTPTVLDGYEHSVDWWTKQFAMFDAAVKAGTFIAHPGEQCKRCGVAYACPAVGGRQAMTFDPLLREGVEVWQKRVSARVLQSPSRGERITGRRGSRSTPRM